MIIENDKARVKDQEHFELIKSNLDLYFSNG